MPIFNVNISETILISDAVSRLRNLQQLGLVPKQVKALLLNQSDDRTGVKLSWQALADNADTYQVYRLGAIVQSNISSEPIPIVIGDTLILKVNGGKQQTITFSGAFITSGAATVAEIVANINDQIKDAAAFESQNPLISNVYLRTLQNNKQSSIKVVGGTSNSSLNFPSGLFSQNIQKSVSQLIATTTQPTNSFEDVDGLNFDSYFIRAVSNTILSGQDSVIKTLSQFFDSVPPRTIINGFIFDSGGNPSVGKEVVLRPSVDRFPSLDQGLHDSSFGVSFDEHKVVTDQDGYFEIEVISGIIARLTIESISYDFVVQIPVSTTNFTKLSMVQDDLRISTTSGIISRPGVNLGSTELVVGEVKVINDDSMPIPVLQASGEVFEVQVSNFPPSIIDAATNTKLDELIAIFDGTSDIGDVSILNTVTVVPDGGTMPISGNVGFSQSFLPLSDGNNWLFQNDSANALTSSFVQYNFGFTSIGFALWSDEDPTAPGSKDIQFSWDGVNIAGTLKPNEAIGRDNVRQTSIYLRSVAAGGLYRIEVWG